MAFLELILIFLLICISLNLNAESALKGTFAYVLCILSFQLAYYLLQSGHHFFYCIFIPS